MNAIQRRSEQLEKNTDVMTNTGLILSDFYALIPPHFLTS
jgi:hypothetical protein